MDRYIESVLVVAHVMALLFQLKSLQKCSDRMDEINRKLNKHNIQINYRPVHQFVIILIGLNVLRVVLSVIVTCHYLCTNLSFDLFNMIIMHIAVFVSNLSKIWFVVLVSSCLIQYRSINNSLDSFLGTINGRRLYDLKFQNDIIPTQIIDSIERNRIHLVRPYEIRARKQKISHNSVDSWTKLIEIANIHDEITELGKLINNLFSFQILLYLAYAFLIVTADLYFLYVGLTGQPIPVLFQCAANREMSMVFFSMIFFYLTSVAFTCWRTQKESNRIGSYLLRIANKADDIKLYEMVKSLQYLDKNEDLSLFLVIFLID